MFYYPIDEVLFSQRVIESLKCYINFLISAHLKECEYPPVITEPVLIDFGGMACVMFVFELEEHKMAVPNNEWQPKENVVHCYSVKLGENNAIENAKSLCSVFENEGIVGMLCICDVENTPTMFIKINDLISDATNTSKIASDGVLFELNKLGETPKTIEKEWITITKFLEK